MGSNGAVCGAIAEGFCDDSTRVCLRNMSFFLTENKGPTFRYGVVLSYAPPEPNLQEFSTPLCNCYLVQTRT